MDRVRNGILVMLLLMGASNMDAHEADSLFLRFESRFTLLDSIIHHPVHLPSRIGRADYGSIVTRDSSGYTAADSLINNKVSLQTSAMRSVTGLSVNGQAYGRLDEGFGLDEEDALSRYKGKIQAELRWNFLNSSLINRKGKTNEIRIRGDMERLQYKKEDIGRLVASQKEYFRMHYDSLLCGVLMHRIANLSLLDDAQSYLLAQGGISSDDLLNVLNEKAEAERMLATIINRTAATGDLSNPGGIVVKVDSARLMAFVREYSAETSTLVLREQLLGQQIANTTYWNTLNLSPFIRYSYYMRPTVPNSSNIDAGVSFIIPLSGETKKKRAAMRAGRAMLAFEKDRLVERITDNIRLTLLDVGRLNHSIKGEVARLAELKKYLGLRRNAYDNRIGEYNYLSRMKEYNTYLMCCERLLSFSYQRDCLLASLQNYLPEISILEFCEEDEIQVGSTNPISRHHEL